MNVWGSPWNTLATTDISISMQKQFTYPLKRNLQYVFILLCIESCFCQRPLVERNKHDISCFLLPRLICKSKHTNFSIMQDQRKKGKQWWSWPGIRFGNVSTVETQRKPRESGSAQLVGEYHAPLQRMGRQVKRLARLSSGIQQSRGSIWADKGRRTCKQG